MKPRRHIVGIAALLLTAAAQAQINLPTLPGGLPQVGQLPLPLPSPLVREGGPLVQSVVQSSVRIRARDLQRRYPDRVERDPRGAAIVRSVIVALSPEPGALQQALSSGFQLLSDTTLQPWGDRLVSLLAPRGTSTQRALRQLRAADPAGSYDFDHLFVESAVNAAGTAAVAAVTETHASGESAALLGMIDGGVDVHHAVFSHREPQQLGCEGHPVPSEHGTAVASLLTGDASPAFRGAAPGATLLAVDVYCGGTDPGGRVRDIAAGLAQLVQNHVRVINLSFVGPANVVLERVIRRALDNAIVIVAAAGNDGPNAAALFPASYPGVIAVTAVDARNNVLLEACRGDQISFSAPGADMMAATRGGGYAAVRGTSYAAPLVAGLIARQLEGPDSPTPQTVLRRLADGALDRGRHGRDASYGFGVVAQDLRTAPAGLTARTSAD